MRIESFLSSTMCFNLFSTVAQSRLLTKEVQVLMSPVTPLRHLVANVTDCTVLGMDVSAATELRQRSCLKRSIWDDVTTFTYLRFLHKDKAGSAADYISVSSTT